MISETLNGNGELCHLPHSVGTAGLEGSVGPVEQVEGYVPESEKSESDGKVDQEPGREEDLGESR